MSVRFDNTSICVSKFFLRLFNHCTVKPRENHRIVTVTFDYNMFGNKSETSRDECQTGLVLKFRKFFINISDFLVARIKKMFDEIFRIIMMFKLRKKFI